jgi:hypothetical protein
MIKNPMRAIIPKIKKVSELPKVDSSHGKTN